VQWVNGDATKAEHSFFKINQQGTPIDPTELSMLKARSSSNAMAARAIIRAGVGHKYWSKFPPEIQMDIEKEAKNVYDNLFRPQLQTPIKTTDIPIAGKAYSAGTLPLIFDLVNLANNKVSGRVTEDIPRDVDGKQTVEFSKENTPTGLSDIRNTCILARDASRGVLLRRNRKVSTNFFLRRFGSSAAPRKHGQFCGIYESTTSL
jgi:hypothetical protein